MNFLIPIFSRYGSIAIQFAIVTLIALKLSTDQAGTYFSIAGAILSLYFVTGVGLPDGLVLIPQAQLPPRQNDCARTLAFRCTYLSALSIIPLTALFFAGVAYIYSEITLAIYSSIWLAGYCLIFIAAQNLIALGYTRSGSFVFYTLINACLCVTTIPYLLYPGAAGLHTTVAITGTTALISGALALFYSIQKLNPKLGISSDSSPPIPLSTIMKTGMFIATGRLLQAAIIWTPVWIAGALLSMTDAAQTGVATRLLGVVGAAIAAIRFSIRPKLAGLAQADKWPEIEKLVRKVASFATILALSAVIFIATLGNTLLPFLFGNNYQQSSILLLLLLGASIAESFGGPVDEVLKMSGNARTVFVLQVVALLLLLITGTLFAELFGARGICAAFSFTFALLYGAQIMFLYKTRGILATPLSFKFLPK